MIAALLFMAQVAAPQLPPGVSPDFSAQVYAIEKLLEAGEFAQATTALDAMPTAQVKVGWDDSALPAELKPQFEKARDLAFATWKSFAPPLSLSLATDAPLMVKFVPSLEAKNEEGLFKGMVIRRDGPKTEALIGIQRSNPLSPSTDMNIHNDVVRAIGTYLGVADSLVQNTGMAPQDFPTRQKFFIMRQDSNAALANLAALSALRAAATASQKVVAIQPKLAMGPVSTTLGGMLKGEKRTFNIELANEGTAPIQMWVKPDCGCTTVEAPSSLAPGEKRTLSGTFDSSEFDGPISKRVVIVTNDPAQPARTYTITGDVKPMFRFLTPDGPVAILDENGGKAVVYLTFTDVAPFVVQRVDLLGLQGQVEYDRWKGELPDPERGEASRARSGYKFTISFPAKMPPGRAPAAISIQTDSKIHPRIQFMVQAQKGIVALPDEMYMGEATEAKAGKFIVSRPGKPFKIVGIDSESPNIRASVKAGTKDEYTVEVEYDGKAAKGELVSALIVKTDDAKQPTIRVPVVVQVR
jgi:hypothetical protein